ncbi:MULTISPECIES: hypothetical protein [Streptomyces violaceusniger group]
MDQLMIPKETARIDHPDVISRNIRVNGIGHLALAVHFSVAARIHGALDAADEAPTDASSAVPDGSEASELPNVNRTSGQGSTYSQPKDGQMPFAEMLKTHGRLSLPRTAGYSRR